MLFRFNNLNVERNNIPFHVSNGIAFRFTLAWNYLGF
jgi:hypothetical protein